MEWWGLKMKNDRENVRLGGPEKREQSRSLTLSSSPGFRAAKPARSCLAHVSKS